MSWRRISGWAALAATIFCGCLPGDLLQETPARPITIALGDRIDEIGDYAWPRQTDGRPLSMTGIEKEREITIILSSGRVWSTKSRVTIFSEEDGCVNQISVCPLHQASSFEASIRQLEDDLKELVPKDRMEENALAYSRIAQWKSNPPEHSPFFSTRTFRCRVDAMTDVFVELRAVRQGWYLSYDFFQPYLPADGEMEGM